MSWTFCNCSQYVAVHLLQLVLLDFHVCYFEAHNYYIQSTVYFCTLRLMLQTFKFMDVQNVL